MSFKLVQSLKGGLSCVAMDKGERIACASDSLDLMANCPSHTIVLLR
jgi:hypothetical protein